MFSCPVFHLSWTYSHVFWSSWPSRSTSESELLFFGVDYAGRLRLAELPRIGLWLQHILETSWERCSSRYLTPTSISSTIILTRQAWPQSRKARYSTTCKTVVATTAWGSGSPDLDCAHLILVVSACNQYLDMPFLTLWTLYELPSCAAAFAFD